MITLHEVTRENWRATLRLSVHPDQQHFVSEYTPIAAIILAKAYVRPGGLTWTPYAILAGDLMIGLVELAYTPGSAEQYWIYHFFIDQAQQGKGYGKAALLAFVELVRDRHPACQHLSLTVHPENQRALHLYTGAGFEPTGAKLDGESVYTLALR